jgi:hypothetical protein
MVTRLEAGAADGGRVSSVPLVFEQEASAPGGSGGVDLAPSTVRDETRLIGARRAGPDKLTFAAQPSPAPGRGGSYAKAVNARRLISTCVKAPQPG